MHMALVCPTALHVGFVACVFLHSFPALWDMADWMVSQGAGVPLESDSDNICYLISAYIPCKLWEKVLGTGMCGMEGMFLFLTLCAILIKFIIRS